MPARKQRKKQNTMMPSITCLFYAFSILAAGLVTLSSHAILNARRSPSSTATLMSETIPISLVEASSTHYLEQLTSFASSFNTAAITDFSVSSDLRFSRPSIQNNPITVAYVIAIQRPCEGDISWIDRALVLRHSIHLTSLRGNPQSVYDYRMIALVDTRAEESCSELLHHAGYQVLVKQPPVWAEEIVEGYLKKKKQKQGTTDFLPLYAYELTEYPLVVSLDLDSLITKPMDDVFDAMLYHPTSFIGRSARQNIHLEFRNTAMPENIQAVITKDWPQVMPGRKPGVRPGLFVVKPNPYVFALITDVIRRGDYVDGYSRDNGWGGLGYGGLPTSTGMSGLMAYVYEAILYDTVLELNQCRYNHVGMDVLYRAQPSFQKKHKKVGQCRNDGKYCEDCMVTHPHDIYSILYGQCPKPWNCIGEGSRSRPDDKMAIPEDQVNLEHCLQLMGIWHGVRTDFESKLYNLTAAEKILSAQTGTYLPRVFAGHCGEYGEKGYMKIAGSVRTMQRIPDLYK